MRHFSSYNLATRLAIKPLSGGHVARLPMLSYISAPHSLELSPAQCTLSTAPTRIHKLTPPLRTCFACSRSLSTSTSALFSSSFLSSSLPQSPSSPSSHEAKVKTEAGASPPADNYYTLFPRTLPHGPPPHGPFAIDLDVLRKEYIRLMGRAHPDRIASHRSSPSDGSTGKQRSETDADRPPETKADAETQSARIGHAYKTLCDPLRRAKHVLSLHGLDGDTAADAAEQPLTRQARRMIKGESGAEAIMELVNREEFLADIMEAHSLLEEEVNSWKEADERVRFYERKVRQREELLEELFDGKNEEDEQGKAGGRAVSDMQKNMPWSTISQVVEYLPYWKSLLGKAKDKREQFPEPFAD